MRDYIGIRQRTSYKDMKITYHGGFRMADRKEITNIDEKKRAAYSARYKGEFITRGMCMSRGWSLNIRSGRLYSFCEGNIFVFGGKHNRTLITVIPIAV